MKNVCCLLLLTVSFGAANFLLAQADRATIEGIVTRRQRGRRRRCQSKRHPH